MAKIKICGLTCERDVEFVNEARPDYVGFVFAKSRRRLAPEAAARLRGRLAPGIVPVGVFVDAAIETVENLVRAGIIEAVQLHGQEDAGYIARLREKTAAPVIKAARVKTSGDVARLLDSPADHILLDGGMGGAGAAFDWGVLPGITRPWFLAGGITPENIGEALRHGPCAVDVSSGAETGGVKDRDKILALTEAVRRFGKD